MTSISPPNTTDIDPFAAASRLGALPSATRQPRTQSAVPAPHSPPANEFGGGGYPSISSESQVGHVEEILEVFACFTFVNVLLVFYLLTAPGWGEFTIASTASSTFTTRTTRRRFAKSYHFHLFEYRFLCKCYCVVY